VLIRKSVEIKRKTRARHKIRFLKSLGERRGEPREEENQEKGGLVESCNHLI